MAREKLQKHVFIRRRVMMFWGAARSPQRKKEKEYLQLRLILTGPIMNRNKGKYTHTYIWLWHNNIATTSLGRYFGYMWERDSPLYYYLWGRDSPRVHQYEATDRSLGGSNSTSAGIGMLRRQETYGLASRGVLASRTLWHELRNLGGSKWLRDLGKLTATIVLTQGSQAASVNGF